MLVSTKARAEARALLARVPMGIASGALIGLALGGVFLAGGMGHDAQIHAKVSRIAKTAGGDFSENGLAALAASDPAALAVALRYEPSLMMGAQEDARQYADLTDRLSKRAGKDGAAYVRASVPQSVAGAAHPAAQPWTASPLDQARQLDCLTQAVYYEARGETPAGQAAVAQVVLNRVRHRAFPNSVCAVVYQGAQSGRGCQFSFACNGAMRGRREGGAWNRAQKIAERAMNGYVMADVGNATHFHVTSVNPRWGNLMRVAQIGMHVFYRFGGKSGSSGAFTVEPEPEIAPAEAKPILASLTIEPTEAAAAVPAGSAAVVDAVARTEAPVKTETAAAKAETAAKPEQAVKPASALVAPAKPS